MVLLKKWQSLSQRTIRNRSKRNQRHQQRPLSLKRILNLLKENATSTEGTPKVAVAAEVGEVADAPVSRMLPEMPRSNHRLRKQPQLLRQLHALRKER
jgi:hypothetical protein